jgi:tetratricopeptide (TPR) repeat protein
MRTWLASLLGRSTHNPANLSVDRGLKFRKAEGALIWVMLLAATSPALPSNRCGACHPKEAAAYAGTQMGRSLGPPVPEPAGSFLDAPSHSQFTIESSDSRMLQRVERDGLRGEHEPVYRIGSGAHAIGYLIEADGHLFQSPLGYYSGRGWGLAPGYENSAAPDFYRPIAPNCLFCHAGRAQPIAGTLNTYQTPPFEEEAITCERCHGSPEAHLRSPLPGSIINPAKLAARARDSICEQCHLLGEARIPNPGKEIEDFRPGLELEDVFSVYVSEKSLDPSSPDSLQVISQSQQLALSRCARRSGGKLWCGTCHDPHLQPSEPKGYFSARCLSCHGTALLKTHPKPSDDCVGCHMPRRPVTDGAHTVFTDHRITRRPTASAALALPAAPSALVVWHDPPSEYVQRNLGLAEMEVGERLKAAGLVTQGVRLLMACWPNYPNDPPVLNNIAQALFNIGEDETAASVYEHVIEIEPGAASNFLHAGVAWRAAHNDKKAITYFERALEIDPLLEEAYQELIRTYLAAPNSEMLRQTCQRYLKAFPQSLEAQAEVRNLSHH